VPERTDFAALPTSWALTLWDALPVYASVEGAFAILVLATLAGRWRERVWNASRHHIPGAIAYLTLFDATLAIAAAAMGVVIVATSAGTNRASKLDVCPASPFAGLRARLWEVLPSVATGAALAAIIKIILRPLLGAESPGWLAIAVAGGIAAPVSFGAGALPALAIASASGSALIASAWFVASAVRIIGPSVVGSLRRRHAVKTSGATFSRVEDA
jgi:hypothetical protein